MNAQGWFEYVRSLVLEQEAQRLRIEEAEAITEPKGQQFGSMGHDSGLGDASAPIIKAMEAKEAYERRQVVLERLLEVADVVLYGKGGLASRRSATDADCICGYYLMGMTWRQVADEMVRPESADGPQWCKRRAYRAFEWLDSQRM